MPIPGVTSVAQKIATGIGDLVHRIVRALLRPAWVYLLVNGLDAA